MITVLRRALLPLVVLVAAAASIVYGALRHTVAVVEIEEVEDEITIVMPSVFGSPLATDGGNPFDGGVPQDPGGFAGGPPFGGDPGFLADPAFAPPKIKQKVVKTTRNVREDLEPRIVRDATVGSLALLESGELKRTCSGGDEGPALCPT